MSARGPIIAIDGPAGAGKTTAARGLAARLGIPYLDTGATFRAIALKALRLGVDLDDGDALRELAVGTDLRLGPSAERFQIWMDGEDVTGLIRDDPVTNASSRVARQPRLREHLMQLWREMARGSGAVLDGRDIGTVVFPDADAKFFLTARPETRARRRFMERPSANSGTLERVRTEISARDEADTKRLHAPLRRAADAIEIDTSELGPEATLDRLEDEARQRLSRP